MQTNADQTDLLFDSLINNPTKSLPPILNIPPEVLSIIFGQLTATLSSTSQENSPSLSCCALVCTAWTPLALDFLYSHIRITTQKQAVLLANPDVQPHMKKTATLGINTIEWSPEPEAILRACVDLKELHLFAALANVPSTIFLYPSLASRHLLFVGSLYSVY